MNQDILLTAAVPLLILFVVLYGSKRDEAGTFFFGKEYTRTLKGVCALMVMMVHVPEQYGNPLQDALSSFAFVAVTCFFMISAYGMHFSLAHKEGYLRGFWRGRLVALLVPQLLVNVFCFLAFFLLHVLRISTDAPAVSGLLLIDSYVMLLLTYCLLFFIVSFLFRNKGKSGSLIRDVLLISAVVLSSLAAYFVSQGKGVMGVVGWPYERMGLVWGLLLFSCFPVICSWLRRKRIVKLAVVAVICLFFGILYLQYKTVFFWGEYLMKLVLGLSLIAFLFLLSQNRSFSNVFSRFFGDISYEIYLLHSFVYLALESVLPALGSGLFILLSLVITILFSFLIHILAVRFAALLRGNTQCK